MRLRELLNGLFAEIPAGMADRDIPHLRYDSRKVEKGDLFFAVAGYKVDGHTYLPQVEQAGAAAAVVEKRAENLALPQIVVPDSRLAMAMAAANLHRQALNAMKLIGVTGTNGKTTTTYLIRSILEKAGWPCGLIGTIRYEFGKESKPAPNTTPEAIDLCEMIDKMWQSGQKACVMEISSHALALKRVAGWQFDVAVFTNLSRDHMDFHKDEEEYFQTKARIFDLLKPNGGGAVNIDDSYGLRLHQNRTIRSVPFGLTPDAQVRVTDWQMDIHGMKLKLKIGQETMNIQTRMLSRFNLENIMAAAAAVRVLGVSADKIKAGIEQAPKVPGRMELYHPLPQVAAVIDYAHTPDALRKAQEALRAVTDGRLIVVFGAGGDRDRGKRPQMGAAVDELADIAVVTSDNPRSEDPNRIIADVVSGMTDEKKRITIPDRRVAIREALKLAKPGDVILIAGKGHENYQEVNGVRSHFSDAEVVQEEAQHV